MNTPNNRALATLAVSALLLPAAAIAKPGAHGKSGLGHGKSGLEHGKSRLHRATYVFKGTVTSVDAAGKSAVVHVIKGNHWARLLVKSAGADVSFDLADAKVRVADVNADGSADLADVAANDQVIVKGKLSRPDPGAQPLKARQLVDRTSAPAEHSGSE